MDPEEQRRRDEEARRAIEEELASEATQRAFASLSGQAPVADDVEPAEAPSLGNRRFEGDFEPEAQERIGRVDARLRSDPYGVQADVEAGRDADPMASTAPQPMRARDLGAPTRPQASDLRPMPAGVISPTEREQMSDEAYAAMTAPRTAPPQAQRSTSQRSSTLASPVEAGIMARKPALPTDEEAQASFYSSRGLPSDADIRREEGLDVPRGIMHVIASALQGAVGRDAGPFSSGADRLRRERREGLEQASDTKRQGVRDLARARATEVTARGQELDAEHEQRADALAALRAQSEERLRSAQADLAEARTGREQITAARAVEAADPTSAVSARARARYLIEAMNRERVRPAGQQRSREDLSAELAGLSAADIAAMEGEIENVTLGSRRGGTGGGAAGVRLPGGQSMSLEQFRGIYSQRTGRSAEEADAVYANPRARQTFLSQLADIPAPGAGGARSGVADDDPEYRMYGYERRTGDPDTPELDRTQIRTIRERVRSMEVIESLTNELERLTGEISAAEQAGAAIGQLSDQVADAQQLHEQVINALRDIGNYGVPTGNELQRMEALAPTLTSLQGIRNARTQYRALRGGMRRRTDAQMTVDGYRRAGGGGTRATSPTATTPGRFTVTAPGREPQTRSLEWLRQRGFVDAQGNPTADATAAGIQIAGAQ